MKQQQNGYKLAADYPRLTKTIFRFTNFVMGKGLYEDIFQEDNIFIILYI